jgi:hypothetical protein
MSAGVSRQQQTLKVLLQAMPYDTYASSPPPATAPTDATSGSPVIAEASTSAAATVAAQAVLQPTTRGNVPSIQQPAKAPLAWKKQKLPADASVFKDKIWLRRYKNNSRMKRTKVSIVDLHAQQQARQRQGDGSYYGQKAICTTENKRGILPDIGGGGGESETSTEV